MKKLNQFIESEFDRWKAKIGHEDQYLTQKTLGIHDVLHAHFLLADFFINSDDKVGLIGPRNTHLLNSALSRQFVSFDGKTKWEKDLDIIATLFYGLIKNHPFHDCNKRTALLCLLYHLEKCGRTPITTQKNFEHITLCVADGSLAKHPKYKDFQKKNKYDADILLVSNLLHSYTRQIDKRTYLITYKELQRILSSFSFSLENPKGNYIDIVKIVNKSKLFSKAKVKTTTKIGQVGFPSWTSQVGKNAIKEVRKVTGLTTENGYDSQVFFHGYDAMESLINTFSKPLRRLKDK